MSWEGAVRSGGTVAADACGRRRPRAMPLSQPVLRPGGARLHPRGSAWTRTVHSLEPCVLFHRHVVDLLVVRVVVLVLRPPAACPSNLHGVVLSVLWSRVSTSSSLAPMVPPIGALPHVAVSQANVGLLPQEDLLGSRRWLHACRRCRSVRSTRPIRPCHTSCFSSSGRAQQGSNLRFPA